MVIHHHKFLRITIDPMRCFGKPCVRDVRMPVASILTYLGSGMTVEEVLEQWPELERENIAEAFDYAAWTMEETIEPVDEAVSGGSFCSI